MSLFCYLCSGVRGFSKSPPLKVCLICNQRLSLHYSRESTLKQEHVKHGPCKRSVSWCWWCWWQGSRGESPLMNTLGVSRRVTLLPTTPPFSSDLGTFCLISRGFWALRNGGRGMLVWLGFDWPAEARSLKHVGKGV